MGPRRSTHKSPSKKSRFYPVKRGEAPFLDARLLHSQVAVLTTKFDESELRDIASYPDQDHYFNSPSIANLPAIRLGEGEEGRGAEGMMSGQGWVCS